VTKVLEDWWGADEAWKDGGGYAVRELIMEDVEAFLKDADWEIGKPFRSTREYKG
jgi:hypothetical protein